MKRIAINSLVMILSALIIAGCVSTGGSRENNFGYKRPEYKEPERIYNNETKEVWINPLADDEINYSWTNTYYAFRAPVFVPVIIPWWAGYYDWMGYPYWRRGHGVYISFGGFYDWAWYCPWYSYHPYYGHYWYSHNWYHPWYHHPVYDFHKEPIKEQKKNRNFGPSRGNIVNTGGIKTDTYDNKVNRTTNAKEGSTNWKTIYDPKNDKSNINRTTLKPSEDKNIDKSKEIKQNNDRPNRTDKNPYKDNTKKIDTPKEEQKDVQQPKPAKKSDFEYDNKPNRDVNREKPKEINKESEPEYKRETPKEFKQSETPRTPNKEKAPEYKREAPKEYNRTPQPSESNPSGRSSSTPSNSSPSPTPDINRTGNRK